MSEDPVIPNGAALAMYAAWLIKMPLTIAGKQVDVPDAVGRALAPAEQADETAKPAMSDTELARALALIITHGSQEIERLGIDVGALPKPEPETAPAPNPIAKRYAPSAPPRFDVVERDDGSLVVNEVYEVRSSDGRSWHVAQFAPSTSRGRSDIPQGGTLIEWHPSREAALASVRSKIAPLSVEVPQPFRSTWTQPEQPGVPGILPNHQSSEDP